MSHLQNQEKVMEWRETVYRYLRQWRWMVVSIAVSLTVCYFYLKFQYPVYEFTTSVLVIDPKETEGMSVLAALDNTSFTAARKRNMLSNEVELIKSQPLMQKVVNKLELHTDYYLKGVLGNYQEIYTNSPYYAKLDTLSLNQLDQVAFTVMPENEHDYRIEGEYQNEKFQVDVVSLPTIVKLPFGNLFIKFREGASRPTYPVEIRIKRPSFVVDEVLGLIKTDVDQTSDRVNISLQSGNIRKGNDILKVLVEGYNEDAISQINMSAINTTRFINDRLKLITKELSDVEQNVVDFKKTNRLTDISTEAQAFTAKNYEYKDKQIELETQLSLVKFLDDFVKNPDNNYSLIPNIGVTDDGVQSVVKSYNELLARRERAMRSSSEEGPQLKEINQQLKSSRNSILTGIVSFRKGLMVSLNGLKSLDEKTTARIQEVPRQEREFLEIQRQQKIKENLYIYLLQKREEAALTMAVAIPKARVVKFSDGGVQIAPDSRKVWIYFFLLGLGLPLLIIYLKELLNSNIESRSDVEKMSSVPVLSELGHNKSGNILLKHFSQADANAELFRLLRTKLQLALDHPKDKVIMITSTVPGEGKTYVSINLAISLSITDKKVLLVGLDLRKPKLTEHFGIKTKEGVSSLLSGIQPDYKKLVVNVPDYPNLDLMASGAIPPNPNELLQRTHLDEMIAQTKKDYDYVIIDTAPVGAVSDTLLLDRISDMVIYVCRANFSQKQNVSLVNRIYEEKALSHIHLLVNDVDFETQHYYYNKTYHYGYGYGFGYGYGQTKDIEDAQRRKNRTLWMKLIGKR
jgi:capsular exopolysaccharide family